jgi:hypothetical protein
VLTLARAALWALIPAELVVLVLLFSGVTLPAFIGRTVEAIAVAALILVVVTAYRGYRGYRGRRRLGNRRKTAAKATYAELVPVKVRRILGFDTAGAVSLVLWVMRRRHGVPPGAVAMPYSGAQTTAMSLFLFAMVIELVGIDLLFRHFGWPEPLRIAILVIDGYSVLVVLAVIAACITRPHVISDDEVRVRYGAFFDLRIPKSLVTSVRRVSSMSERGLVRVEGEELSVVVSSQTNLVLELSEPVTAVRPLGQPVEVRAVRFFADDPNAALRTLTPAARATRRP